MTNYLIKDSQIHFRQSFSRPVLERLFLTIYALGLVVYDTGSKIYPYALQVSESEFLSILEMSKE